MAWPTYYQEEILIQKNSCWNVYIVPNAKHNLDGRYYKSDVRLRSTLISLLTFIGLFLMPLALVVGLYNHQLASVLFILGALMFWKVGDYAATVFQKGVVFSGSKKIESTILYGTISSPDKIEKLEFMPSNIGGLYREGDEIVLGTLFGEYRCYLEEFSYKIKKKNLIVAYIDISIANKVFSFMPNWNGPVGDTPLTPDTATWGSLMIDKIIGNAERLSDFESQYFIDSVEKNLKIEIKTEENSIEVTELAIRNMNIDDYYDKPVTVPHLQAMIRLEYVNSDNEINYDCAISYYNENGVFLGVDDASFYDDNRSIGAIVPFSTNLNIPTNTHKAVINFTAEKKSNYWDTLIGIAMITGIVVFGIWATKVFLDFFM